MQASMRGKAHQWLFWRSALLCWAVACGLGAPPCHAASIRSQDIAPLASDARAASAKGSAKNEAAPLSTKEPPAKESSAKGNPAAEPDSVQFGLLLPLSGAQAALGKAMLDAATLALYDMQRNRPLNHGVPLIRLLPRDTQGTPEGAQAAFRALAKSKPAVILGPLFSAELEALIPLNREERIPLLAFTNNATLADRGAYQFGYFAAEQAARLVRYAARQQVQSFAAVTSADGYGRTIVDQLVRALRETSIGFGPLVLLPPAGATTNAEQQERQLGPLIATLKERGKQRSFLFVAEGSPKLESVVLALAKARLLQPNLVLAGSGIWDDPVQLASPALRGAVFITTPREGFTKFVKRYQVTYRQSPPRVASLAYDASALLVSLVYDGGPQAISDAALQSPEGFATPANGLMRFRADGQAERRLAVYLADGNGGARLLEAAPTSFDE